MLKKKYSQSGIALPVVLIFVVVMLLLGVTAIRNVTLGEKMAGNTRSQELAFQAAEQALRACENAVLTGSGTQPTILTPLATTNLWDDMTKWADTNSVQITSTITGVSSQPRCMVEDVKSTLKLDTTQLKKDDSIQVYRVTARGVGASDNSVVMLQSYLKF
ncbi:pilus assembly PilX family protein [Collimonas antrihumi]|uniref:pilus assembly PilX family protein n=1 Tax=Collimonas antrihumi TaxID=1940615 RepID=UPI001B8AE048|nr:PilX N-terminal domain-containing pilus assembly protein [Collimonas antrihumi]